MCNTSVNVDPLNGSCMDVSAPIDLPFCLMCVCVQTV